MYLHMTFSFLTILLTGSLWCVIGIIIFLLFIQMFDEFSLLKFLLSYRICS